MSHSASFIPGFIGTASDLSRTRDRFLKGNNYASNHGRHVGFEWRKNVT